MGPSVVKDCASHATPKSTSFTWTASFAPRRNTLDGLMSRWTMPWSWAALSALAIWRAHSSDSGRLSGGGLVARFQILAFKPLHRDVRSFGLKHLAGQLDQV